MENKNYIVITVEGGCVVDVDNLPEGYGYEINDLDMEGYDGDPEDDE